MKVIYILTLFFISLFAEVIDYNLIKGWSLKSTPSDINSSFNTSQIDSIYSFSNESGWIINPKNLSAGDGFWIKAKTNLNSYNFNIIDNSSKVKTLDIKRGWNLIGFDIKDSIDAYYFFDFDNFIEAYKYNGTWQTYSNSEFTTISKNEGIWLYSNQNTQIPFYLSKELIDETGDSKLTFKVKSTEKIIIDTSLILSDNKNIIFTNPVYGKLSKLEVIAGEKIEYTPPSRFIGLENEIIGYKIENKDSLTPIENSGNIIIEFPEFKKFEVEITDSPYEDIFEVRAQKTYDIKIKSIDKDGQIIKNATFFLDVPEDKKGFFGNSEDMVYAKNGKADFVYDSTLQQYVEIIGKTWDSKFTYGQVIKLSEYEAEVTKIQAENEGIKSYNKEIESKENFKSWELKDELDEPTKQDVEVTLENGSFNFQIYIYSGDNQKIIKNIRVITYDKDSTIQKISYPQSFSINPSDILSLEKGNIRQKVIFNAVDKYGNPVVKGNRIYAGAFSNIKRKAKIVKVDDYNKYKVTIQDNGNNTNYSCLNNQDESCIIKPNDWLIVFDATQSTSQVFSWWEIDDIIVTKDSNVTDTLLLKDKFIDSFKESKYADYKEAGFDINDSWWKNLEIWIADNKVINECTKGYSVASIVGSDGKVESLGNSNLYGEFFTTEMGTIRGTLQFDEWLLDKPVYIFATAKGLDDNGKVYRVGNLIEHNLSMSNLFGQKDIFIDASYKMNSETNMTVTGLLNLHPHQGTSWMSDEFSFIDFIDSVEPGFDKDTYSLDLPNSENGKYSFFTGIALAKKKIKIYAENTIEKFQKILTQCDGTYSANFTLDNASTTNFGGSIYEEKFCASKQDFSHTLWWEVDTSDACIEKTSYNPNLGIKVLQNGSIYVQYKLISHSSIGATFFSTDPNLDLGVSRLSDINVSLTLVNEYGKENETMITTNSLGFAIFNNDKNLSNNSQLLSKVYTKNNEGNNEYQLVTQGFEIDESYTLTHYSYSKEENATVTREYSLKCDKIDNDDKAKDCSVAIIKNNYIGKTAGEK